MGIVQDRRPTPLHFRGGGVAMTFATQRRDFFASTSLTPPNQIPLVRNFDDARAFGPRTAARLREIIGAIAASPQDGRLEALKVAAQELSQEVRNRWIDRRSAADRLYD